ncbi:MAG TPA: hypothetical protein VNO70_18665 [Blastocatellia bacterium]|nr:hypothetical protein [Blastocatellia bacterium]
MRKHRKRRLEKSELALRAQFVIAALDTMLAHYEARQAELAGVQAQARDLRAAQVADALNEAEKSLTSLCSGLTALRDKIRRDGLRREDLPHLRRLGLRLMAFHVPKNN